MWRRVAVAVACTGTGLAVPAGAMALSTHSATTSTTNSAGLFAATAKCGAGEHVFSGGFNVSNKGGNEAAALVSHAVKGDSWTVDLFSESSEKLTVYAYCARKGTLTSFSAEDAVLVEGANTTVTEPCGAGQTLVSGGYALSPASSAEANSATYRDYAASGAWTAMSAFETTPASLTTFGYCKKGVVFKVRSSSSASIPKSNNGSATASCHKGETLLSGGYTTTPTPDWNNSTGPDFFYSGSWRSGGRSWTASAHNFSPVSGEITAFAYCKT